MNYTRTDHIVVIGELAGVRNTAVYTLEWAEGNRNVAIASIRTTVPRFAVSEGYFDLNSNPAEPIDFIPDYVENELSEANSEYAAEGRALTIAAITAMDRCVEGDFSVLDELYAENFGNLYVTYESSIEAKSK